MELSTHQKHLTEEKEKALDIFFSKKKFQSLWLFVHLLKIVYLKAWKGRRLELLRHVADMMDTCLGNATELLLLTLIFTSEHFLKNPIAAGKKELKTNATGKGKISGLKKKIQPTYPSTNNILTNSNSQIYLITFHFRNSNSSSLFPSYQFTSQLTLSHISTLFSTDLQWFLMLGNSQPLVQ